jgi:hypothetical protein
MWKKQIAFISNAIKAISEQWMWRLEYLKDSIRNIGVMENVEIDLHNNAEIIADEMRLIYRLINPLKQF